MNPNGFDEVVAELKRADRFVLCTHEHPDGDALGSMLTLAEAGLVREGLPFLKEVWANADWQLFAVEHPTPLVEPPGRIVSFTATQVVVSVPSKATVMLRVPASPWLAIVDAQGTALPAPARPDDAADDALRVNVNGCLTSQQEPTATGQPTDTWTVLHAPTAGTYRIGAPYTIPPGTPCPQEMANP